MPHRQWLVGQGQRGDRPPPARHASLRRAPVYASRQVGHRSSSSSRDSWLPLPPLPLPPPPPPALGEPPAGLPLPLPAPRRWGGGDGAEKKGSGMGGDGDGFRLLLLLLCPFSMRLASAGTSEGAVGGGARGGEAPAASIATEASWCGPSSRWPPSLQGAVGGWSAGEPRGRLVRARAPAAAACAAGTRPPWPHAALSVSHPSCGLVPWQQNRRRARESSKLPTSDSRLPSPLPGSGCGCHIAQGPHDMRARRGSRFGVGRESRVASQGVPRLLLESADC